MSYNKMFRKVSFEDLKNIVHNKDERIGYVYLIEFGGKIKIGCTKNPYSRICQWRHIAEDYNNIKIRNVYISVPHENYMYSEKRIHNAVSNKRIPNTELFDIGINEAIEMASKNLDFRKKERKDENEIAECLKELLFGKKNGSNIDFSKMSADDIDDGIELIEQYKEIRDGIIAFFSRFYA